MSADGLKAATVLVYSMLDEKQRRLCDGLESLRLGYDVDRKIADLLGMNVHTVAKGRKEFSLKANRKTIATSSSPDRDQQFGIIRGLRESFGEAGNPIIRGDSKKKELIGNFANSGRVWTREPLSTNDHDFRSDADAIAVPYGLYDVQANTGTVIVGTSSDTPAVTEHVIPGVRDRAIPG